MQPLVKNLVATRSTHGSDALLVAEAFYGVKGLGNTWRPDIFVSEEHLLLKRALAAYTAVADKAKQTPSALLETLHASLTLTVRPV